MLLSLLNDKPGVGGTVGAGTSCAADRGGGHLRRAHCLLGVFKRPIIVLIGAVALFAAYALIPGADLASFDAKLPAHFYWWGDTAHACRLFGVFLVGALYFLYRDRLRFSTVFAIVSVLLLAATLFVPAIADAGVAIFGGYLVFFIAQRGGDTALVRINNKNDISYGIYLYGWPVEKLLNWYLPGASLWPLGILTVVVAVMLGGLSWFLIEKPVMRLVRGRR